MREERSDRTASKYRGPLRWELRPGVFTEQTTYQGGEGIEGGEVTGESVAQSSWETFEVGSLCEGSEQSTVTCSELDLQRLVSEPQLQGQMRSSDHQGGGEDGEVLDML